MDKLVQMRLRGMATALQEQADSGASSTLSFEERLALIVDREWLTRQERSMNRRVKLAKLRTEAYIEDIDYRHPRGLDRGVMQDLITSRWVHARRNVIITGATGLGKTWLANALSHKACRDGFSVAYKRVPRLVEELNLARADGTYLKLLAGLARTDLLVLDDWGLAPLTGQTQHSVLEIIDDRAGLRSTLLTSQLPVENWHDTIGDPSVADALLDRVLSASTIMQLKGESMRKRSK
ncbi:MAG: AAA family ATPase [Proteobacteria bacterium]|nr:AAA family ATPase [Pseudomonadota bacterium]